MIATTELIIDNTAPRFENNWAELTMSATWGLGNAVRDVSKPQNCAPRGILVFWQAVVPG